MNKIPGYNKCPHCGEWSYELVDGRHTCKPLWFALVLPADASERDIAIAIAEADGSDGWDRVHRSYADHAAENAALRAWDSYESPTDRLVLLREAVNPDVIRRFYAEARIELSYFSVERRVTP